MNFFVSFFFLFYFVKTLDNGLGKTPPKGWLSWEYYRCNTNCKENPNGCLSEKMVKKNADYMVSTGLRDAGYIYVIIDDCWMNISRDKDGKLVSDKERFPSGIKSLAKYIHKKGLKFGIYADMGLYTCQKYPGSLFHLQTDAETFAEWGVDYLKMDGCYGSDAYFDIGYPLMSYYLNRTGKAIFFSCSWPDYEKNPNYENVAKYCNTWRNAEDIQDSWDSMKSILDIYAENKGNFLEIAAPGQFNDPDMLLVGTFGLSKYAQRTQMIMWAMLAAPLIISTDVSLLEKEEIELLTNPHILAINNDPLGKSAIPYENKESTRVWVKELSEKRYAFAFVSFADGGNYFPYTTKLNTSECNQTYHVVEMTSNEKIGHVKSGGDFTVMLYPYGTFAIVLIPDKFDKYVHIDFKINF